LTWRAALAMLPLPNEREVVMAEIFGKSDRKKDRLCPRDNSLMGNITQGEAVLDICGKCGGQFFDTGEMFKAFGMKADPSYWDRPETGGVVAPSELHCPNCEKHLLAQNVEYEGTKVEIDRCGKCGGVWLDKGEVETIMKIGDKLESLLEAEKAKAKEELDKMGAVDFSSPGLIARFLGMFKKKG
jgi:Zn-finger nucleic acid-binding protein